MSDFFWDGFACVSSAQQAVKSPHQCDMEKCLSIYRPKRWWRDLLLPVSMWVDPDDQLTAG